MVSHRKKFKSQNTDNAIFRLRIHQSPQPDLPRRRRWKSGPFLSFPAAAAWSPPPQPAALGPAELESSTAGPGAAQTQSSRELSGRTRKSKAPQNSEIPEAREQCACCSSVQSRPTSVSERFPNQSDFLKRKHPTVKTHIEVINHRPQQKRSVNEGSVDGGKKGETKGSLVSASPGCQPIATSPPESIGCKPECNGEKHIVNRSIL